MTSKNESRLTSPVGGRSRISAHSPAFAMPRSFRDSVSCARSGKTVFPLHLERNEKERRPSHGTGRGGGNDVGEFFRAGRRRSLLTRVSPPTTPSSACGAGREEMPVEPNAERIMKIMIFSVKLDKFTGFFDKLLNLYFLINYYDSVSYVQYLASWIQIWRRKKLFGSPAFPNNSPHWRAGRRRVRSLRPPPSDPDSGVPSPSVRSGAETRREGEGAPAWKRGKLPSPFRPDAVMLGFPVFNFASSSSL